MKAIFAISLKEYKSFFYSPVGYLILAGFTALTGIFFYLNVSYFVEMAFRDAMMSQQYRMPGQTLNVNLQVIRPFFYNISLISLFTLPLITMRLYSEEKRAGTVELLYTAPITPAQIITGKFLAGLLFYVVLLIPTILFNLILFAYGDPEIWPLFSGYLGLILMGSAYVAAGLLISTMTENQIIAAIGGFAFSLLLWAFGWGASQAGPVMREILNYLSIINHFEDFSQGVIDTTHVAYYLLFSAAFLYLAHKMIESVKWRA